MRALTFQAPGQILYDTVPDPKIEDTEDAIVQVHLAGLCGSDLHVWHGRETGLDVGTVMGHEFVGEVVEVGSSVRSFEPGDLVAAPFTTCCDTCDYCHGGLTSRCIEGQLFGWVEGGKGLHGAQAEYVRVPLADSTLVEIPDRVSPEEALLAGDVMATGWFAVQSAGVEWPKGPQRVAVVGCGAVGLMACLAALDLGGARVYAIDTVPERLALAKTFLAQPIHLAEDPVAVLRRESRDRGADVVIEAVGSPAAGRLAYDLLRPGGTLVSVGVHTAPHFPFSPAEAYDKNLTFATGRCPARRLLGELLGKPRFSRWDVTQVITHRLPLSEGPRAYEMFAERRDGVVKVVFQVAG